MGWNSTHRRAVHTTTRLVVELCHQMEQWRRLLRHVERLETRRDPAPRHRPSAGRQRSPA